MRNALKYQNIVIAVFDGRGTTFESYENDQESQFQEDVKTWTKCGLEFKVFRYNGKPEDYTTTVV